MKSKSKYLISIRHGERTDHCGIEPKIHKFDPELTEKGKSQGYEIGNKIIKYLMEQRNIKNEKIGLISSPFSRALQTTINIKKSIEDSNIEIEKILINNLLSESIYDIKSDRPISEILAIYNDNIILKNELKNIKLEYLNDLTFIPLLTETEDECFQRLNKAIESVTQLLDDYYDIIIVISHATPINFINKHLLYPYDTSNCSYVKYCSAFIYEYTKNYSFIDIINL